MQTKLNSFIEASSGTAIGFVISLLIYQFVISPMHLPPGWSSSVIVTVIYTVVSVVRSYVVRRWFNRSAVR
jgi:acid phosphatase family membrane protein YuiD